MKSVLVVNCSNNDLLFLDYFFRNLKLYKWENRNCAKSYQQSYGVFWGMGDFFWGGRLQAGKEPEPNFHDFLCPCMTYLLFLGCIMTMSFNHLYLGVSGFCTTKTHSQRSRECGKPTESYDPPLHQDTGK